MALRVHPLFCPSIFVQFGAIESPMDGPMNPGSHPPDFDRLLTETQAADLLRLSTRTLQAWRSQEVGPEYVKAGRTIRYRRSALIEWMDRSTIKPNAAAENAGANRSSVGV